jgi:hypothetical protein
LTVVAYIVANGVRYYELRGHACQRPSGTSLPQRFLDHATMAQAPAVCSATASEPGFCRDAAGAETHHWAPRSLFHNYNTWPTAQLCPSCHALWHGVMRADAERS